MATEPIATTSFEETVTKIKAALPDTLQNPQVGIICGSGLSGLVNSFRDAVLIPYEDIPGFMTSTVPGHQSTLAFGFLGNAKVPVVAMLGRFHAYEGHILSSVVYPVRIMANLGVKDLIVTNAAGSLNPDIPVGTIVVIRDHIALPNMTGMNPLLGPQTSLALPRFLPLSDAYSPSLRRLAFLAAHHLQIEESALAEGTYAWVSGPTYETPAEGRFLRQLGADVVGMSTIPEVLSAREEGLNVMVLSLVTNFVVIPPCYRSIRDEVKAELAGKPVAPLKTEVVSHEEVLQIGKQKADLMKLLVEKVVDLI